jgi:hypothetical protein
LLPVATYQAIREALTAIRNHDHPPDGNGPDLHCHDLHAWLGGFVPTLFEEIETLRRRIDQDARAEADRAAQEAALLDARAPLPAHRDAGTGDLVPGRQFRRHTEPTSRGRIRFTLPCHPRQQVLVDACEARLACMCATCRIRFQTTVVDELDGGFGVVLVVDPEPTKMSRPAR